MIFSERILQLWRRLDPYVHPSNRSNFFSINTTMSDLLGHIIIVKDLLDESEIVILKEHDKQELEYLKTEIPEQVKMCSLFKKRTVAETKAILKILDTPCLDGKKIIALRKDVIRKEKERVDDKKDLVKDELKTLKKEKKEGSWLDL